MAILKLNSVKFKIHKDFDQSKSLKCLGLLFELIPLLPRFYRVLCQRKILSLATYCPCLAKNCDVNLSAKCHGELWASPDDGIEGESRILTF